MKSNNSKNKLSVAPMYSVISQMISELAPVTSRNTNRVINNVSGNRPAGTDPDILVSTLTTLVNAVIGDTDNSSSVRISAQKHLDIILLHVSHSGTFNFSAVSECLSRVQPLTQNMDGYIGITTYLDNTTTIAFSFTNVFRNS